MNINRAFLPVFAGLCIIADCSAMEKEGPANHYWASNSTNSGCFGDAPQEPENVRILKISKEFVDSCSKEKSETGLTVAKDKLAITAGNCLISNDGWSTRCKVFASYYKHILNDKDPLKAELSKMLENWGKK